ncbi:hypothetical protein MRX96_013123 [Rhipicephalus microplus]
MLANGQEMNPVSNVRHGATRSQDDAMVGYFFQRPQSDPDFQNYNKQSRWALGDDSVLEARGTEAPELETDFQALALETSHQLEIPASTKKLWSLEETGPKPEDSKGLFLGDQWRDPTWSTGGHASTSEHAVSQPIMVQRRSGSYPGSEGASMLSPRSSETSGLGVKMVEYVLGSSPTIKDLDSRMVGRMHVGPPTNDPEKVKKGKDGKLKDADGRTAVMQANGIMHNGIDDDKVYNPVGYRGGGGSRQASPSEDKGDKLSKAPLEALVMGPGSSGPPLEAHFDHHTMDLSSFDYPTTWTVAYLYGVSRNARLYLTGNRMKRASLQDFAAWVKDVWCAIPSAIIIKAFKKCGISNAMDGTEDRCFGPFTARGQHGGPMALVPGAQYSLGQGQQQGGALGVPPPAAPTPSPFAPPSTPYLLNQDPYGAPPHPLGIVTG